MAAARGGDTETAARCELATTAYRGGDPTPEQVAGATLRALFASDVRRLREGIIED